MIVTLADVKAMVHDIEATTSLSTDDKDVRIMLDENDGALRYILVSEANMIVNGRSNARKETKCAHCGVERKNCKPGGQWYSRCPFNHQGDGHEWV